MSGTKIKISQLPQCGNDITNLMTLGVDAQNHSVQVPFGEIVSEIQQAATNAAQAAQSAAQAAQEAAQAAQEAVSSSSGGGTIDEWSEIDNAYAMLGDREGMFVKIAAGSTVGSQTAPSDRDRWVFITSATQAERPNIIGCRYVGKTSSLANTLNYTSVQDLRFLEVFPLKITSINTFLRSNQAITDISPLNKLDMSQLTNADAAFMDCRAISHIDLSNWVCPNLTSAKQMFQIEYGESIDLIDVRHLIGRRVTNASYLVRTYYKEVARVNASDWWPSKNLDGSTIFYNTLSARYIEVGVGFFGLATMSFSPNQRLGFNTDNTTSNGWLEAFAEVAPTIRLSGDWDDTAWSADPTEANESTPKLISEEAGTWYVNDGESRAIALHANLKNAAWAQPHLATLQSKGYTIV